MTQLILATLALGIVLLAAPYFALQAAKNRHLQPLLLVLLSMGIIASGPVIFALYPGLIFGYIAVLPLTFLALTPGLWLYTEALTATEPWQLRAAHAWHFWPVGCGLVLTLLILTLPSPEQHRLFLAGSTDISGQTLVVAIVFLLAVLFWLGQSSYYLMRILRRVRSYRLHLRQVFADDGGKRLGWIGLFSFFLLVSWCYAVAVLLAADRVDSIWLSESVVVGSLLLLVWLLAWGGLQQQPGFAGVAAADLSSSAATTLEMPDGLDEPEDADLPDQLHQLDTQKYQRSALGEAQSLRIAKKLHDAIYVDALYLDPSLTLYKLATHLGVSGQYLSQTLNQTMKQSFFEYINHARVAAAKTQLLQSDAAVLTIAMAVGFNAKSSFYKAFKAVTGMTPVEFRAAKPRMG